MSTPPTLNRTFVKLAAQPINWINDDFKDLGADTTLEQCLAEMKLAGFEGSELGHRFPADGAAIKAVLAEHGLILASGWHSTFLASRSFEDEERAFLTHAEKLKAAGSDVVILAECTHAIHGDGAAPLRFGSGRTLLDQAQWRRLTEGLDRLAMRARTLGMKTAYHEHMGTVIQDAEDVDALMANTRELGLLVDTGHLFFAGANPLSVLNTHAARVTHVHLKNVRAPIATTAEAEHWSFERAVRAGVFTVPGDDSGAIDYRPFLGRLAELDYRGWLVVEAEQDPKKANPLEYARRARAYLQRVVGF